MIRRSQRGFTLVELMIVVVIVGVLSVLAITGYRKYSYASRNSEAERSGMALPGLDSCRKPVAPLAAEELRAVGGAARFSRGAWEREETLSEWSRSRLL